jgi:hypothetical protein
MYHHPWMPRLFYKKYDGGKGSGVTGYFLIEWKKIFSVGLLRFNKGSRENYHSHAFNAITWWLFGEVKEQTYAGKTLTFKPSLIPKITKRDKTHRVEGISKVTWALTLRGPWTDTWYEIDKNNNKIILTHGRKILNEYYSSH